MGFPIRIWEGSKTQGADREEKNQRYMLVERLVGMRLREMFEIRAC